MAQILDHNSSYFNQVVLPYCYDPRATSPQFESFLRDIFPRKGEGDHRIDIVQEAMGYSLLTNCTYETAFILVGTGRNGKSTLLRVWEAMLGTANVAHIALEQLAGQFRLIGLRGKLLNVSTEVNHLGRNNEALLKQIISGEPVEADVKHKPPVNFTPYAKLVFACNTLPSFVDPTDGFWRRWKIIPFDVVIPEADVNPNLANELIEELPGIFNFAVAGLRRLRQNGGFTHCNVCAAALAEHRQQADSVEEFLAECCVAEPRGAAYSQALYDTYACFCDRGRRKPVGKPEFGRRLTKKGYCNSRTTMGKRPRVYTGINLSPAGDEYATWCKLNTKACWTVVNVPLPGLPSETSG